MEARSVYLGIAVRMRGGQSGALCRDYLHSALTEAYWYAVRENESYFIANLAHAMMIASLYGNDRTDVREGNEQIPKNYRLALETMPYVRRQARKAPSGDVDGLVEEWRRVNETEARKPDAAAAEGEAGPEVTDG